MPMSSATYADVLRPAARRQAILYDTVLVLTGAALVALAAQVAVYLPFNPVPVSGQTLAVLLVGALLGSRRGMLSLLVYLLEGAFGLPVFAGGVGGVVTLLGPTGGYLLGFVAAACLAGGLAERGWDRRVGTTLAAMALGSAVIDMVGVARLAAFTGLGDAVVLGLVPFVPGDVVKVLLAAALLPGGWRALAWMGRLK